MPALEAPLSSLLICWERRVALVSQPLLSPGNQPPLQVLEEQILKFVVHVLDSQDARKSARLLRDQDAQQFLDCVQHVLRNTSLPAPGYALSGRKLILKLSEACEKFPSSLSITGVSNRNEHPMFHGGFGDIFSASYQGKRVALKRLRIFTGDPTTTQRTRLQFCKEALIWEGLHHRFILPFLGIDNETFPSSLCMVSPWMKNGTVLEYLRDHSLGDVDRLLLETAEGLRYLHSMNIVHGDLRGNNILISDDFSVLLADFGLANIISATETTVAAPSSNHPGSTRWFAPELIHPTALVVTASSGHLPAMYMLLGVPPFHDVTPDISVLLKVMGGGRPGKPVNILDALWALITTAWGQDWRARPSAAEIITSFPVSTPVQCVIRL
ncbi:kinase-like domain-containing protein [Mycena olivaceomarginata]|nr:kinase-like domain-containing protein [Mycena olivaceomarginata]